MLSQIQGRTYANIFGLVERFIAAKILETSREHWLGEIFVLAHYRESIDSDANVSELWKDVFLFHWREEPRHAIVDEIKWRREHDAADPGTRRRRLLPRRVRTASGSRRCATRASRRVRGLPVAYIVSGVREPRFARMIGSMIAAEQSMRITSALAPLMS